MPRNYQRTKNNPYYLPQDLFMRVRYIIKGYPRLKKELWRIRDKSNRFEKISAEVCAIESAVCVLKEEYRLSLPPDFDFLKGYWNYAYFNIKWLRSEDLSDEGVSPRTWSRFKQRLAYEIAERLNLI